MGKENVIVHIYNRLDDLRGGYISPIQQASQYTKYNPLIVYMFENTSSEYFKESGLNTVLIGSEHYNTFFEMLRGKSRSFKGIFSIVKHTISLVRLINKYKVGIIHVQNFESLILSYVAAKLTKCKLILHVRGDADFSKVKPLLKLPENIIAVSNSLKQSILTGFSGEEYFRLEKKIEVIENGVEVPTEFERQEKSEINISIVGAIHDIKGQYEFIRDVWKYLETQKTINLFIIGADKDQDYSKLLRDSVSVESNNRKSSIQILGLQKNMEQWYKKIDIVVIYSIYEGFPRVALEAMSYKIPIIGTNIVGNIDIIEDGYNGYLVDRNLPLQTVKILERMIEDDQLRLEMGRNGREMLVNKRYDIGTSAKRIEGFYDRLLRGEKVKQ